MTSTTTRLASPTWDETFARYGAERILAAKALLELSPALLADARQYLGWSSGNGIRRADGTFVPDPEFQYDRWLASVDKDGRGWSSTEWRLFRIVECLLDSDRQMPLLGVLDGLGSWETDVWRVLVNWGTGGNNRNVGGRCSVVGNR